jgi:dGTP triphosphohydrolase
MRLKHNKKRNTAFLFEALTREYVKAVVKKNSARQSLVKKIIKEHFSKGTILNKELSIYKEVLESGDLDRDTAVSLLSEAKQRYGSLGKKSIFSSQNKLIKEINYTLSSDVLKNFVPNYKNLATIYNIFNDKTSMKEKILLEEKMVESLTTKKDQEDKQHIDNLTYKTFVESFNKKYSVLPQNQKELLTNYIASFSDNSLSLKVYLNEQVSELKNKLKKYESNDIFESEDLKNKYGEIMSKLDSYKSKQIDDTMITDVLRIQGLVQELENA